MKTGGLHLAMELTAGLLACGVVLALAFDAPVQHSALAGVAVATTFGLLTFLIKARVAGAGPQQLKALITVQAISFGLRLVALLLGALATKRQGLDPVGYVLGFFAVALVQQVIEVRFILSVQRQPGRAEVGR